MTTLLDLGVGDKFIHKGYTYEIINMEPNSMCPIKCVDDNGGRAEFAITDEIPITLPQKSATFQDLKVDDEFTFDNEGPFRVMHVLNKFIDCLRWNVDRWYGEVTFKRTDEEVKILNNSPRPQTNNQCEECKGKGSVRLLECVSPCSQCQPDKYREWKQGVRI